MTNSETAIKHFKQGYNCAQSVFLTYAHKYGIDATTALKLSSSFGGGMGRLREVCGAVTTMFALAGLKYGYSEIDDNKKTEHYILIQKLADKFKSKHKTIICRELLGLADGASEPTPQKRTEAYYENRPCENFIKTACEILDGEDI